MESQKNRIKLSIIIPLYNEEKNISILYKELVKVLRAFVKNYEIIFVDDGSTDRSPEVLNRIIDTHVRIITSKKNKGLSSALSKGFLEARGEIIITMDSDLQHDPRDIPLLIKKLGEKYDVVCGWRWKRQDSFLSKKLPSCIFNAFLTILFKIGIHDSSCTLRAYKKKAVEGLILSEGMHRYLPVILSEKGNRITEIKVNHRPRIYDKPKYNSPKRILQGTIDLIKLKLSYK
jgi:glycosyltransferase involved in cell wall biosynthesis